MKLKWYGALIELMNYAWIYFICNFYDLFRISFSSLNVVNFGGDKSKQQDQHWILSQYICSVARYFVMTNVFIHRTTANSLDSHHHYWWNSMPMTMMPFLLPYLFTIFFPPNFCECNTSEKWYRYILFKFDVLVMLSN